MPATSNLTNITLAEAGDGGSWIDLGGGQGSAQSSDLPIQGAETRARRIDAGIRGFGFDTGGSTDVSSVGTHIGFWANVLQWQLIGTGQGLEFSISDSASGCQSGNWDGHQYPASAYPVKGGYIRVWVDVSRTREAGSGTLALANARGFGCEFEMGNVGGNAPNCHLDRIDYTNSGITIDGGSVGTPATFQEAIDLDAANAFGVLDADFLEGPLLIGGAATVFSDTNFSLKANTQPLAASDWIRIDTDLTNAGTEITWGSWTLNGIGLTVTGTAGTFNMGTGNMVSAPAITLNSAVTWSGKLVSSGTLDINGADVSGTVFEQSTGTSAAIWDLATDPASELSGTSFESSGTGHGLELGLNSPTTVTLTDVNFNGYASSNGSTGNEAIWVRRTSGTVTINWEGAIPSVRTDGATVNIVSPPNTLTLTGLSAGTRVVLIDRSSTTPVAVDNQLETGGQYTYSYNYTQDTTVWVSIITLDDQIRGFELILTSNNQTIPASQQLDRVYVNPV